MVATLARESPNTQRGSETFKPVHFTCPRSPDHQFVERAAGMVRGDEELMTIIHHFTNGGFVATTPEQVAVVEALKGPYTVYRETGQLGLKCPRCFFRTGIMDAMNEHLALCEQ